MSAEKDHHVDVGKKNRATFITENNYATVIDLVYQHVFLHLSYNLFPPSYL